MAAGRGDADSGASDGDGPLAGQRVLVTRALEQAGALCERIVLAGGEPVLAPTIAVGLGDLAVLDDAVRRLARGAFAGVCLTSVNGVLAVDDACVRVDVDPAVAFSDLDLVGVVGPRTAGAVRDHLGVAPTVVPDVATGAALGAAVPAGEGAVLLPQGDLAGDEVADGLRAAGWRPEPVVAYRTVTAGPLPAEVVDALGAGQIDLITFTSASTVRGFVALVGDRPRAGRVVTIGPVTSAACRELGVPVDAEADPHDLDGLIAALTSLAAGR